MALLGAAWLIFPEQMCGGCVVQTLVVPLGVTLLCHGAYQRASPRRAVPGAAGGVMTVDAAARPRGVLAGR